MNRALGRIRSRRNDIENHVIDEFMAGRIDRREFFRRGAVVGMSVPLLSAIVTACGGSSGSSSSGAVSSSGGGGKAGGTLRLSVLKPTTEVDPVLSADVGSLAMIAMTGEFLCVDENQQLTPWLATSWSPNSDASVWTFKIRQGVTFNDGTPMTANDVAASINRLSDPANKSNALSAFTGVLSKNSAKATDAQTVEFTLDAPNGSFPYYLSSDNYNAIILPASYTGGFDKTWPGTGPWKNTAYSAGQSATFVRNDQYWGKKALPDTLQVTLSPDEASQVLALQGNQVDVVQQVTVSGAQAILNDPNYHIISVRASTHRELSMRCDKPPFNDKRVRQAVALTLDRNQIVQGLFQGKSDLGNDSPFAPVFPQTDTSVPQRNINLDQAKSLLSQAGQSGGFSTELVAIQTQEVPQYAQIVVEAASKIGVNIKLSVEDGTTYYGDAVYGKSPWLDSIMSLVDYGHRGVPNVFLSAPLMSDGTWNAAHFKNPQYDGLVKQYIAAVDLQSQRSYAKQIQTLLLDETPIIYAYFYNYLSATRAGLSGLRATAMGQTWTDQMSVA
ncbi:MAG TPA: ABC transporter substrate-binding protein [Gaiellales bacterium]|nr:ABC transporter substrate-binding protein [Gaiellales bacterium]